MNRALKKYRRQVKQRLRCVGQARQTLLDELDRDLARFAAEEPTATYADAAKAFGAPEKLAAVMNKTLTQADETRYQRRTWLLRGAVALLLVLMGLYIYYLLNYGTYTVIEDDDITVIYETGPGPIEPDLQDTGSNGSN